MPCHTSWATSHADIHRGPTCAAQLSSSCTMPSAASAAGSTGRPSATVGW